MAVLEITITVIAGARQVEMASSGSLGTSSFDWTERKTMGAVGEHASSKSNVLSPEVSALAIPWKRVALFATTALGFFLLGFVPMWVKAGSAIEQRDAAQRAVRLAQLHNTLATAVIDVQRGQFEPARQLTSDFYTNLRRHVDSDSGSLFTPAQREELVSLLSERDELITLLARSDPGSIERLYRVYATYSRVTNNGK
jgi:hypothetical protein